MRNFRLVLVLAVVYIDMLGVGLAFPVIPMLVQNFEHGSVSSSSYTFGLLVSAYAVSQFLFSPLFGAMSDCYGRRPIILAGLGGSAASYLLMAVAPNLAVLAIARLLAGVMGGSVTTASAYIADITPPEKRAQSFGLIGAVFGVGLITGPVVGGLLGNIDLRLPFAAAGLLCVADLMFSFFALPESLAPENRKPLALKHASPVGALTKVCRYPSVGPLLTIFVIATFANRVGEMIWVLYTGYRYHWGRIEIGLSISLAGFIFVISQGWFTRVLIPRIGEARAIVLGLAMSVLISIGYGIASESWMFYATMPFAILGWAVAQPALQGLMSRAVPADEQGLLQGAMASVTNLSSIVGPLVWTGLFGYFVSDAAPAIIPGAAFFVSGLLFLVAFAMAARWRVATLQQPAVA